MACNPFDCTVCGERHTLCKEHRIACPACNWSGGNFKVGQPCVKCDTPCEMHACKQPPYRGLDTCKSHGAGNEQSKKASRKFVEKEKMEREVRRQFDLTEWDDVVDPYSELSRIAGKEKALETLMFARIEELASLKGSAGTHGERIAVEYEAWQDIHGQYVRTLMGMAKLDLTERIARMQNYVDEATAQMLREALGAALATVDLTQEQRDDILRVFGSGMRVKQQAALPGAAA